MWLKTKVAVNIALLRTLLVTKPIFPLKKGCALINLINYLSLNSKNNYEIQIGLFTEDHREDFS